MSNKLFCPFCGEPLCQTYSFNPTQFWCSNYHDPKHPINVQGTKELWQELITTRKALDESEYCCTEWEKQALDYKAENIKISKGLDFAQMILKNLLPELNGYDRLDVQKAIKQINEIKGDK